MELIIAGVLTLIGQVFLVIYNTRKASREDARRARSEDAGEIQRQKEEIADLREQLDESRDESEQLQRRVFKLLAELHDLEHRK